MTTTTTKTDLPPRPFLDVFARLVSRTKTTGRLEPQTAAAYYELLRRFPLPVIEAAATHLAVTQTFFPAVAEWWDACQVAMRGDQRTRVETCSRCQDRGLLRVLYETGEPFDIAICGCAAGQWFRDVGDEVVRRNLDLTPANRVAYLEDFDEFHVEQSR